MRRLTKSDKLKIREFVEEQIDVLDARIEEVVEMKTVVKFRVADCDMMRLEDHVNQRLGKYAYPWISWTPKPNLLKVSWYVRG